MSRGKSGPGPGQRLSCFTTSWHHSISVRFILKRRQLDSKELHLIPSRGGRQRYQLLNYDTLGMLVEFTSRMYHQPTARLTGGHQVGRCCCTYETHVETAWI